MTDNGCIEAVTRVYRMHVLCPANTIGGSHINRVYVEEIPDSLPGIDMNFYKGLTHLQKAILTVEEYNKNIPENMSYRHRKLQKITEIVTTTTLLIEEGRTIGDLL